jgi:hypothetical protein
MLYGISNLDEGNGGVGTTMYFDGNVSGSTATIFNHTNGRSRSMSSAFYKAYYAPGNYTIASWAETPSAESGYTFFAWPNDGLTLHGFFGSPTTWNNYAGTVPNQPETTTRYTSFLRAF